MKTGYYQKYIITLYYHSYHIIIIIIVIIYDIILIKEYKNVNFNETFVKLLSEFVCSRRFLSRPRCSGHLQPVW